MSNENVEEYSEDENILKEEEDVTRYDGITDDDIVLKEDEIVCCSINRIPSLDHYFENDVLYGLPYGLYSIDGKHLYIRRNIPSRCYRIDLEEAQRKRMRIPLQVENGNIVYARADLLIKYYRIYSIAEMCRIFKQYEQEVQQQQNQPLETAQQQQHGCKTAVITTALAILSTILIALVLHH